MIATVALEGRKGEMDACSNLIASEEAINEDLAKRDPSYVYFEEIRIFPHLHSCHVAYFSKAAIEFLSQSLAL